MMFTPDVRVWAKFVLDVHTKTPKYVLSEIAGNYAPFEALKGRDGRVSFYLIGGDVYNTEKSSRPELHLQGKSSINVSGLKFQTEDDVPTRFAYGNPPEEKTYSKKDKPNPFYPYKDDGFLFMFSNAIRIGEPMPDSFELIVIAKAKYLVMQHCRTLHDGGYDEMLKSLHDQAVSFYQKLV